MNLVSERTSQPAVANGMVVFEGRCTIIDAVETGTLTADSQRGTLIAESERSTLIADSERSTLIADSAGGTLIVVEEMRADSAYPSAHQI